MSRPALPATAGSPARAVRRVLPARHDEPTRVRVSALLAIPLGAALLFLVLPLVSLTGRALSDDGLNGFTQVMSSDVFIDASVRTLLLSTVVTACCLVLGTIYALALVTAPPSIGKVLLLGLLASFWISLLVRTFGWVIVFQPNGALSQLLVSMGLTDSTGGLLQTTTAMYPAMIHVMLPYFVLPVYAACLDLRSEDLRAGQSLGAGPARLLWLVVLPALRPAVAGACSLVFLLSLAFYVTPLLIGGPQQLTIATLIDRQFNQQFDLAGASVMGLVLLVFVLAIYLVIDRFVSLVPRGFRS